MTALDQFASAVRGAVDATSGRWPAFRERHVVPRRRWLVVGAHALLLPFGYLVAFALRFDFNIADEYLGMFLATVPWLLAVRLIVYAWFGLYRGYWQHFGLYDLVNLAKGVTLGSILFAAILFVVGLLDGLPRSVFALEWIAAIFLAGGMQFMARCIREGRIPWRRPRGKRTIVIGAGEAAEQLLRQAQHDGEEEMHPVALVDDDPRKLRMRLHGVPVLGTTDDLPALAAGHRAEMLVIATPSASGKQMRRIVDRCIETKLEFKTVPSLAELLGRSITRAQLRDVRIEDLLGRAAVRLDLEAVERDVAGRVVLVTGGAGSIGSELVRQLARLAPRRLIVLDQAESPLHHVHLEVSRTHPQLELVPVIGSVTDEERLTQVFAMFRPDHVYHAAAYKHVPMMEANPIEAVRNNVLGTLRTALCAARHGTVKFVLISTDKAVNPSSVMGATKRIAERLILGWPALRGSATDFRAVRFGNVLGSEGSVVPLFREQLAAGGPLTVTHPEVTRFFMTIPEAAQLVLQAAELPEAARRIVMLEMGEPVRLLDLAENLIRLAGLEPYRDIPIAFTGLRPGEKLNEELMSEVESTCIASVEKIRLVQSDDLPAPTLERGLNRLMAALLLGSVHDLLNEIRALVPECVPPLRNAPSTSFYNVDTPRIAVRA